MGYFAFRSHRLNQTIARLSAERDSLKLIKTDWTVFDDNPEHFVEKGDVLYRIFLVKTSNGWEKLAGRKEWPPDPLKRKPLKREER